MAWERDFTCSCRSAMSPFISSLPWLFFAGRVQTCTATAPKPRPTTTPTEDWSRSVDLPRLNTKLNDVNGLNRQNESRLQLRALSSSRAAEG